MMLGKNVPTTNKTQTKINHIFKLIQQYPLESAYPGLVDIFRNYLSL